MEVNIFLKKLKVINVERQELETDPAYSTKEIGEQGHPGDSFNVDNIIDN